MIDAELLSTVKQHINQLTPNIAGQLLQRCVPYRRDIIKNNMQQVFGQQLSADEYKNLQLGFYTHMARTLKETATLKFKSLDAIKQQARVIGKEHALKAAEKNKGLLLLTGHFGNWELAPIAGILNFPQYENRFHIIRKQLKTKWLEQLLFKRYRDVGLKVISKDNAMQPVCNALEAQDAVVFVFDQYASLQKKDGIATEFFGRKTGTYQSLAMLAFYTGAPVVPVMTYRDENNKHVMEFFEEIPWIETSSVRNMIALNTKAYNKALERMVLTHPEQWLWLHRRWK